jgi:hypothetical protein
MGQFEAICLVMESTMRLEDCELDIKEVVSAPLIRRAPEGDWIKARDSGAVPKSVFELYQRASYLSFGAAPPFLRDDENVLFSYFGMLLTAVMNTLVEADDERRLFVEARALVYDPGKHVRGDQWDSGADARARRHFRYLIISFQAALDALADLIAVFLTGLVPPRLGRAMFSQIENWLKKPLPVPGTTILTPQEHHLRELYDALRPLVHPDGPSRDWMPLMRLYRNKGAHLGGTIFRYVGLHDRSNRFYTFIPRQWPYILEQYIKTSVGTPTKDTQALHTFLRETLINQDILAWVEGLHSKVQAVIDAGFVCLNKMYRTFQNFSLNSAALTELNGTSERYDFEYFPDVASDQST